MRAFKIFLVVVFAVVCGLYGYMSVSESISGESVPPVLKSDRDILEISVADAEEVLFTGLTATDAQDGDITDEILISGISKLTGNNTAKVTYLVFDSDHNMASLVRQIRYTDYESPRFSLDKPLIYTTGESIVLLDRLHASDVIDGDITQSIRVSPMTATSNADTYMITCQVTNSMGDTVYQEFPVIRTGNPAFRSEVILKQYLLYLDTGASFNARSFLSRVQTPDGAGLSADVTIKGSVDTKTPGTYMVRYTYPHEEVPGVAILTVVVE